MEDLRLWYREPAAEWEEALPVGNGWLGGMVYGGIEDENILLNDDTLWSGYPRDKNRRGARRHLAGIRELLFDKEYTGASERIWKHMLSDWTEAYQPLGGLRLTFDRTLASGVEGYRRELNLNTAVCETSFTHEGHRYVRQCFSSSPSGVMVVRLTCEAGGKINFTASLDSPLTFDAVAGREGYLILRGRCPAFCAMSYQYSPEPVVYDSEDENRAIRFEVHVTAVSTGGRVDCDGASLCVYDADEAVLILTAATDFCGYNSPPGSDGRNITEICRKRLDNAVNEGYRRLFSSHVRDYQSLFNRVELKLSGESRNDLPTDERLKAFHRNGRDNGLISLMYQYGRYLMIACSRPGTQPANLQGIWNREIRPPWGCNYTVNINTEMNYWPAETCNLSECHEPLLTAIEELSVSGRVTAREHYGCGGWTIHHNTDLWRASQPVGGLGGDRLAVCYGFWPMAAGWLCRHLWEHYLFTMDRAFLEKSYPIIKGACRFYLDFLTEDREGRYLVTNPSTSPENLFLYKGERQPVSVASTMDIAILRELFQNVITASEILSMDEAFRNEVSLSRDRLPPYGTGRYGQLLEWLWDFDEVEQTHRHVSHLYGLFPGDDITGEDLTNACKISLDRRGDEGTGWSLGWKINLWARLRDGNRVLKLIKRQLTPADASIHEGGGTYPNLFDAHPPFQIDGNFGFTSGVAEMLLQSHNGLIRLLPALPDEWRGGTVKGLRARGGIAVSLRWADGGLVWAELTADHDLPALRVAYGDTERELSLKKGKPLRWEGL